MNFFSKKGSLEVYESYLRPSKEFFSVGGLSE